MVGVPDKFWGLSQAFHSALSMVSTDVTGLEHNRATVSIVTWPGPATKSKNNNKENNKEEGGKRGRS